MGLPRRGHAVLGVYDVRGRCVQVLFRGEKAAGTHSVVWDGRDAAGRPLATGVYFVRLEMEGESATRPLILIR